MTTNEIETAAIEAAAKAMLADEWLQPESAAELWKSENENGKAYWITQARAAIRAYERAMWRPIEKAPKDGTKLLLDLDGEVAVVGSWTRGENGDVEIGWRASWSLDLLEIGYTVPHFRPLPRREGE